MQIIREKERRVVPLGSDVIVYEYDGDEREISGGVAVIKGRYPERGWAVNKICKELVYVLEGSGKLLSPNGEIVFGKGDVLLVGQGEKYAWEGDMTLFMATTPTFDPAQHAIVSE